MTIDDARRREADGSAREGLTRRELGRLVSGGLAVLSWHGLGGTGASNAHAAQNAMRRGTEDAAPILFRLSSNENNYGLAPAAFEALKAGRSYANRYGGDSVGRLTDLLAKAHGVPRDHVLVTPGSGEILRAVTLAFTSTSKALLTGAPSFESPERTAHRAKAPVTAVPVAKDGALDLAAMAAAATPETGLAFVCNPNNPTGGINPGTAVKEFCTRFRASAPEGYVLVDEAYFDYVIDPSYATAIPLVASDPRIIVSRTFSKIHGMAGLRVGYAIGHPDALALVREKTSSGTLSSVSAGAALASLEDQAHLQRQRALNAEARAYTRSAFAKAGCEVLPSEANFIMVDVRRPSTEFSALCRHAGVAIARPFPPLTTHARITIGTVEEMKKAVALMIPLLSAPAGAGTISGASAAPPVPEDDGAC
jgi:histidinol-phosphate aminotransferase